MDQEREFFGMTHMEAGAMLLQGWNLPEEIVLSTLYHHDPENAGDYSWLAGLIGIASALVEDIFPLQPRFGVIPSSIPHRLEHSSGPLAVVEMRQRYARAIERGTLSVSSMLGWLTPEISL